MQILGHSRSVVTERYAHLSTKSLQEAADSASAAMERAMREEAPEPPPAEGEGASPARP